MGLWIGDVALLSDATSAAIVRTFPSDWAFLDIPRAFPSERPKHTREMIDGSYFSVQMYEVQDNLTPIAVF